MTKILSISLILLAIIAITYGRSTGYKVDQLEFTNEAKTYERKDEAVNIGLNSNSEDDKTSEGITRDDNTDEGITGDDSTDEGNTSEDNTGEGNTSEDNTGEDSTGEDNTGEGDTDEDNTYGDEKIEDVINNLKEEFKTTKSELKSAIEASKGEIATITASIKASNDRITQLENEIYVLKLSDEDRVEHCGLINSMEDESITASSVYGNHHYLFGPQHSRLNTRSGDGGWFPHPPYEGSWIELNLGKDEEVRAVATQGDWKREYNYVKTFRISYKSSSSSIFSDVKNSSGTKQIFNGNTDSNTVVINDFTPPLTAQFIRIHPLSWNHVPFLRFDVLSC